MLRLLSPLEMVQRIDVKVTDNVLTSGYIGSWIQLATAEGAVYWPSEAQRTANFPTSAYKPAYAIWTEGKKKSATTGVTTYTDAGFSPDALQTKKVTTLFGKWRGLTDQVVAGTSTTPGTLLTVSLAAASQGKLAPLVAYNASGLFAYDGATVNVYSGIAIAAVRNYYTWLVHMGVTYSGVWEIESLI